MRTNSQFLKNSIVETFSTGVYTVTDYDDCENYLYIKTSGGEYEVGDTSLDLSEEDKEKAFDMVHAYIVENEEDISSYDLSQDDTNHGIYSDTY